MGLAVQITFDCEDAEVMSGFWSVALDYSYQPPPEGFETWEAALEANGITPPPPGDIAAIVDPDGVGPRVLFLRVPESKQVKNRVHLDIRAGSGPDDTEAKEAKVEQLLAIGGTVVRRVTENGGSWIVMQDPEGNEFCVT